jgi:hypothetical protein
VTRHSDADLRAAFAPVRALEPTEAEVAAVLARSGSTRPRARSGRRAVVLALAGVLAAAAVAGAATELLPIGTEVPADSVRGRGEPSYTSNRIVVATGRTAVAGGWHATVTHSDQGPCLGLELVDAAPGDVSESCGGVIRGLDARSVGGGSSLPHTTVVYGPAPEEAVAVRAAGEGGFRRTAPTHEGRSGLPGDLYVIEIPRRLDNVTVSWIDSSGRVHGPGVFVPSTIDYRGGPTGPQRPN